MSKATTIDVPDHAGGLPEELLWLDGGQRYVICAFYTPNYLPQIMSLKASVEKFKINHYFKCYQPRGGWEANTRIKAEFVAHALEKLTKHDVAYLDADGVLRRYPELFDKATADVTILFDHRRKNNLSYLRIAAGTLYLRNTPGGREFARRWVEEGRKAGSLNVDEDLIYPIFPSGHDITFAPLPPAYYKIFDARGADPVVEHFQASRGQFKWRKAMRQARQAATVVAAVALIGVLWWLSTRMVSITWR